MKPEVLPISVWRFERVLEGSCNHCQTRDDPFVYVLDFKSSQVRLCKSCLQLLRKAIGKAI